MTRRSETSLIRKRVMERDRMRRVRSARYALGLTSSGTKPVARIPPNEQLKRKLKHLISKARTTAQPLGHDMGHAISDGAGLWSRIMECTTCDAIIGIDLEGRKHRPIIGGNALKTKCHGAPT